MEELYDREILVSYLGRQFPATSANNPSQALEASEDSDSSDEPAGTQLYTMAWRIHMELEHLRNLPAIQETRRLR